MRNAMGSGQVLTLWPHGDSRRSDSPGRSVGPSKLGPGAQFSFHVFGALDCGSR